MHRATKTSSELKFQFEFEFKFSSDFESSPSLNPIIFFVFLCQTILPPLHLRTSA